MPSVKDGESVGAISGTHPGPAVQQTTIAVHGHGGSLQANNGVAVAWHDSGSAKSASLLSMRLWWS